MSLIIIVLAVLGGIALQKLVNPTLSISRLVLNGVLVGAGGVSLTMGIYYVMHLALVFTEQIA